MLIVFLTVPASAAVRSMLWRTGRKLYMYARHDVANDPHSNGEYWLLDHVLQTAPTSPVLLDIGANKGDWSSEALRLAAASQRIHVYAFEPSPPTRIMLASRLRGHSQVSVVPQAVSDVPGTATFFSGDDGAGTNSLSPSSGPDRDITPVTTVDEFLAQSGIDHVAMIKIDTEGFDFRVLKGSMESLRRGRVDIVQFEYNWRWLANNACLRDVFALTAETPYQVGKLVGRSIEFYDRWHPELDRFFEANYVLVRAGHPVHRRGVTVWFDASNVGIAR